MQKDDTAPQSSQIPVSIPDFNGHPYLIAPDPADEPQRLAALRALELLDTPAEDRFDRITRLAVKLFQVPIAYVALVDARRQWFKSRVGMSDCETSRDVSFCSHTILCDEPLIIPDTHADPKFALNPLVIGTPHVRAYAGVPLRDAGGYKVGTFCLADHEPREFSPQQVEILREIAGLVERELHSMTIIREQHEKIRLQEMLIESQREKDRLNSELRRQKDKVESLLLSLMPQEVAAEWREHGAIEPRYFPDVTVLFTDFVGFTALAERLAAEELLSMLNGYFSAFDKIIESYGLEKLKTIGNTYMCVGGLPQVNSSHPVDAVLAAMAMRESVRMFAQGTDMPLMVRIGIHTGPVVAGVVGVQRIAYDIWGETVYCAFRMESTGLPDYINISERTYARVKDFFDCELRGQIATKDRKQMDMYFVKQLLPSLQGDLENGVPKPFQRRYRTYFRMEAKNFPLVIEDTARAADA